MSAPQLVVSGQVATFDAVVTEPGLRPKPPGIRLRLLSPLGRERVIRANEIKIVNGTATTSVVLREVGFWEFQWQDDRQVYEHGRVFVRKTGFS